MLNKNFYQKNIQENDMIIPIFHQPFWLDIVAPGWDVICIKEKDKIIASMPFWKLKKTIAMPPLTQFLGPFIFDKENLTISKEMKILSQLRDELPEYTKLEQRWQYGNYNWLPFYWGKYNQTTKYTYILNNISDKDSLWKKISEPKKRQIKKAKKNNVQIKIGLDFDIFYNLIKLTFSRQKLKLPYSYDLMNSLYSSCKEKKCGEIIFAVNSNNDPLAASFLVWDNSSTYYIISGYNNESRKLGGSNLLMWESILYGSKKAPVFDFEGSMNQGIESFFRSFGGQQTPYFEISKTTSKSLKIKSAISKIKNAILND